MLPLLPQLLLSAALFLSPAFQPQIVEDGHGRPRALVYQPKDQLLYVALSTKNEVVGIDVTSSPLKIVQRVKTGRFPQALEPLPTGGVLVSCRFTPELGRIEHGVYKTLPAGPEHGHRGLSANAADGVVYVASPALSGVKVVSLHGEGVLQTMPTGMSPRALHIIPDPRSPRAARTNEQRLLLVANFIEHTVTVHPILPLGRLGTAIQTIRTEAPVQDFLVQGQGSKQELLLLTHEDRPLDRSSGSVHGLDSVVLRLPLSAKPQSLPILDPGPGRRVAENLTERAPGLGLLAKLDAIAESRGYLAIAGAATDNVLVVKSGLDLSARLQKAEAIEVGTSPVALAFLPSGQLASADRLSDTVTLMTLGEKGPKETLRIALGEKVRQSQQDLGELLFYSRALVPNNVAEGPLSVYACSACHEDGHVDGRRHPARQNRFRSMTKTSRALATTAPYLSLGELADLAEFADNIVGTHAQGEALAPKTYDQYSVTLRIVGPTGIERKTLSPAELRAAMAAYLAVIPSEPSPFVPPAAESLSPSARTGLALFVERCTRCHQMVGNTTLGNKVAPNELEKRLLRGEVALTSKLLYPVGTPILGQGGNNPPSLRGVWDAAPYLSDGSAGTLDDLLRRTDTEAEWVHDLANAKTPALSEAERMALISFLRSL